MLCQCSAVGQVNLKVRFVLSLKNLCEHCGELPLDSLDPRKTCQDRVIKYLRFFFMLVGLFSPFKAQTKQFFRENALSRLHE